MAHVTVGFVKLMARYSQWQNANIFAAADELDETARDAERGAFFGSISRTLNHLYWADQIWLHRFAGTPGPTATSIKESVRECADWATLSSGRKTLDARIVAWADALEPAWLDGDLTWHSGAAGRDVSRPKSLLAVHFFNHQTHHRGQVHAMLTAAGARPGDTDLPFMPNDLM